MNLSKPLFEINADSWIISIENKPKNNKMVGYMYILQCSDGSYYVGSTKDLERRVWEHNAGIGAAYTSRRMPVVLRYYEEYLRLDDAFNSEKQVQGWSRKKREALINGEHHLLPVLARTARRIE